MHCLTMLTYSIMVSWISSDSKISICSSLLDYSSTALILFSSELVSPYKRSI